MPLPRATLSAVLICLLWFGLGPVWGQEATAPQPQEPEPAAKTAADAAPAETAEPEPTPQPEAVSESMGVLDLLRASGGIGATIALLSVAAVALILEHLLTIRRGTLMPPGLAQDLHAAITAGEYTKAEQSCKLRPSYLAYVVLAGLQEVRVGYDAVEKSMEDASAEQAARLFRKVEYLALIGNIAPMLGLLGTVYGLVLAFKKVAETPGAGPAELADGIYLALITTVMGLVVSIPALSAYSIFRNRVEHLASEVNVLAEQIFINYKRSKAGRRRSESADTLRT